MYLHPSAVAVQYGYELTKTKGLNRRFKRFSGTTARRRQFLNDVLKDGFGQPKQNILKPLARLSFSRYRPNLLGPGNRPTRLKRLNDAIGIGQSSLVSIENNWFTHATHLDVLYNPSKLNAAGLGATYHRLLHWLIRSIETESLEAVRRIFRPKERSEERITEQRVRAMTLRLRNSEDHLLKVVVSLIRNLIPEDYSVNLESSGAPSDTKSMGWKFADSDGYIFDTFGERSSQLRAKRV